ncbi:MAG TPA: class I SAM-dependent methyltransferase [Chryseosolibacter sp.]
MALESLHTDHFSRSRNLFIQNGFVKGTFERVYLDIREKEGRLYSDAQVELLPFIEAHHPLSEEWNTRARSAKRLIRYLSSHPGKIILEVGCGNGWLAHRIAQIPEKEVFGLDVNEPELDQAASVFRNKTNLAFILGDLFTIKFPFQFDIILFASSLQYFPDVQEVFRAAFLLLKSAGEIHVIDTPIYAGRDVEHARERSCNYFADNQPSMNDHYFHHVKEDLLRFSPALLYNPASLFTKMRNKFVKDSPFPWLRITKSRHA